MVAHKCRRNGRIRKFPLFTSCWNNWDEPGEFMHSTVKVWRIGEAHNGNWKRTNVLCFNGDIWLSGAQGGIKLSIAHTGSTWYYGIQNPAHITNAVFLLKMLKCSQRSSLWPSLPVYGKEGLKQQGRWRQGGTIRHVQRAGHSVSIGVVSSKKSVPEKEWKWF